MRPPAAVSFLQQNGRFKPYRAYFAVAIDLAAFVWYN